jgi:nitric oxide reductase NorQ protein
MLILQTTLEAAKYQVKPLSGQPSLAPLKLPVEDYKISCDLKEFAGHALGTLFIAVDYQFLEDDEIISIIKGSVYPVLDMNTNVVYPSVAHKAEKQEIIDYLINYLLDSPEYDNENVKKYAEDFKAFGYIFDWDALTAPKPITPGSGGGTNMRRSITVTYPAPKKEDINFAIEPELWYRLVRNILIGESTLLVGPTGSGKTELVYHLAKALGKDLFIQDMGTVLDSTASLAGVHRLNSEGHSEFEYAPFTDYIQSGGIVMLDEINRAPKDANNFVFPCLDSRKYLPIDAACAGSKRRIDVHPETMFFGTANLGAEYSGTNSIDRALLDRFAIIELDYPMESDEIEIIKLRTNVDDKVATAIVKVSNEIRKQYKEQNLSSSVSVRHTLQIAGLVRDGFELQTAMKWTVLPLFEDSMGASERSSVLSIMTAF